MHSQEFVKLKRHLCSVKLQKTGFLHKALELKGKDALFLIYS